MAEKITNDLVKELTIPAKGNRITYDTEIAGFGVRVTANAAKGFILNYRANGRERRITIGNYPAWSVAAARKEASRLRQEVDRGNDPMGERHADRAAPTVNDLCDRYEDEWLSRKRPATARDAKAAMRRFVRPKLGKMKVAEVEYADIDKLHRSMKRTPYQANRTLAYSSKMFSLSIKWKMRSDNPCKGVERFHEDGRERYLSPDELDRLTAALASYPHQRTANAIRLLILTGARRMEVLSATWGQFDLEAGAWEKPSAHTKQKKIHRVPLSAPAKAILVDMHDGAEDDDYVFPGQRDGHLTDISRPWAAICKDAALKGVRVHDLRHSFASLILNGGGDLALIGRLLGHASVATTARYGHLADDPLRKATESVGAIVTGKPSGEVIPFRKGESA